MTFVGVGGRREVPTFAIVDGERCPICGSALFEKDACCSFDKDWETVLRCLRPDCSYIVGRKRKTEGEVQ